MIERLDGRISKLEAELAQLTERLVTEVEAASQAERALESESAHRNAIEGSARFAVSAVDMEGRLVYISSSFTRMLGWREEDVLGAESPFQHWPPEEVEALSEASRLVLSGKPPPDGTELRFRHRDGRLVDVLVTVTALMGADGSQRGWIGAI